MYYIKPVLAAILMLILVSGSYSEETADSTQFEKQRLKMVSYQIEARGISDTFVLVAMRKIERHKFVHDSLKIYAYYDSPLPIDKGQTISQPYIVAIMTELLKLEKSDKVLEIGTGSGYQAAVLGEICDSVFSIEIVKLLAEKSDKLLKSLGYENIITKCGDGYIGWEEHAPFDAIIVTAAPPYIPQPLIDQLAEGGRMVIPVGEKNQELMLIIKEEGKIITKDIISVRFVPMTGEAQKKKD